MKICQLKRLIYIIFILNLVGCGQSDEHKIESSQLKIIDPALVDLDLLRAGPFAFDEAEYDSGPFIDDEVLRPSFPGFSKIAIDIRGRLFLPRSTAAVPLIVFLHGNHGTCGILTGPGNPRLDISTDFADQGSCPAGYVEVPSYRGYDYAARHLASWGYAVISINANRGITGRDNRFGPDPLLVHARGVHVLKHLERIFQWSQDQEPVDDLTPELDLHQRIDWSRVGFMGHSRGGEGVRYAYNIFTNETSSNPWPQRIPGLKIRGIFEIAPVDVGTNKQGQFTKVNAIGVPWSVLIPGCDQDVLDFSGTHPFARMLELDDQFAKSVFTIWGANHNFFNTEWQVSDAPHRCNGSQKPLWDIESPPLGGSYSNIAGNAKAGVTGSETQTRYTKALLFAFFHASLSNGQYAYYHRIFDPQYHLPKQLDALAPSSREFVRPHERDRIFRPTKDLSLPANQGSLQLQSMESFFEQEFARLQQSIHDASGAEGASPWSVLRQRDDFIRPSLAISFDSLENSQDLVLQLTKATHLQDKWTIDLPLTLRSTCYFNQECPTSEEAFNFSVALISADGQISESVEVKDYIRLKNWYSKFFELEARQQAAFPGGPGRLYYRAVPLLFQTARFEIRDFQLTDPTQAITGLVLSFPAGPFHHSNLFIGDISASEKSEATSLPPRS
ncbi:MAG: hypothetical protein ACOH5I_09415 [Oligoflexus sp.]